MKKKSKIEETRGVRVKRERSVRFLKSDNTDYEGDEGQIGETGHDHVKAEIGSCAAREVQLKVNLSAKVLSLGAPNRNFDVKVKNSFLNAKFISEVCVVPDIGTPNLGKHRLGKSGLRACLSLLLPLCAAALLCRL
ncbi:hypothetical protein L484_015223 [Morus notabilis]|uniref:Uncharacterized protein n=1 Tax=Morus notabilis TaxID=981085 RepID=W9SJ34_9ROSA|nr:hypothetical protein L484_015223 [Morus notabilis]